MLCGHFNLPIDDIRAVLVDTSIYTPNFSTHETLSDIPSNARVVTTPNQLSNVTVYDGIIDFDDIVFTAVVGNLIGAIVLYKNGTSEATSWLIAYLDNGAGLPITPTGNDIEIRWSNGVNRVLRI